MVEGYLLNGVTGEQMLVFRSEESEEILRIITRLGASRDKEIRGLAKKLELVWFEKENEKKVNGKSRGVSSDTRSEGRKGGTNRSGSRS